MHWQAFFLSVATILALFLAMVSVETTVADWNHSKIFLFMSFSLQWQNISLLLAASNLAFACRYNFLILRFMYSHYSDWARVSTQSCLLYLFLLLGNCRHSYNTYVICQLGARTLVSTCGTLWAKYSWRPKRTIMRKHSSIIPRSPTQNNQYYFLLNEWP